jgi:hypothetical protein
MNLNKIILFGVLFIFLVVTNIFASPLMKNREEFKGNLSVLTSERLVLTKYDGYERENFDVDIDEENKLICIQTKPISIHLGDVKFVLKDQEGKEKSRLDISSKDGRYCMDYGENMLIGDVLEIGESTIIIEFQEQSTVSYIYDNAIINATLYEGDDSRENYFLNFPYIVYHLIFHI